MKIEREGLFVILSRHHEKLTENSAHIETTNELSHGLLPDH